VTWVDIIPIVLVILYAAGGYFAGLIRRFIGLVALFVAVWAATNMGIQAGGILQQTSSFEIADGRIYGFFGIIFAVLFIVEVATQLAHSQIQIPAVVLNRTLGTIVGVFTAILLSYVVVYELGAAANPIGGAQLDPLQQGIRNAVQRSLYMTNLVNATDRPILALFQPLLPVDPQQYFSSNPLNP
jgi:Colicin V production protein